MSDIWLVSAFKYLVSKQGKKGGEIKYKSFQMVDYLLPYNSELPIKEKQEIFSIRNGMVNIPANFGSEQDLGLKCSAWKRLWSSLCFGKGSDFNLWGGGSKFNS